MAKLPPTPRLNHLAAEAVATAIVVNGGLQVVAASPLLVDACRRLALEVTVASV